jgi:beta-fructofuranosidase
VDAVNLGADSERVLNDIRGNALDIELCIEPGAASIVGVRVCCAADGSEETIVGYDCANQTLFIDTAKSSKGGVGPKVREAGPIKLEPGESLKLRVLIDKSIIEAFANDRQAVMRRIYPDRTSLGTKLFSAGGSSKLVSLQAWQMMPSNDH